MSTRIHRLLSVVAFQASGSARQRYELSNSCKSYTQMWPCSQRHIRNLMHEYIVHTYILELRVKL
jgi:hypothetical protein